MAVEGNTHISHETEEIFDLTVRDAKSERYRTALLVVTIVLVAVGGYGLGRFSKIKTAHVPVRIETFSAGTLDFLGMTSSEQSNDALVVPSGGVVASKNGTKYHLPSCPGASQIKQANMITFPTQQDAKKAGYSPAANCPGL